MDQPAVSAAGIRILRLLVGQAPRTVMDLAKAAGVTRTAVSEQLVELREAGLVRRETERSTQPGRPKHLYACTERAAEVCSASNLPLIMPLLLRALRAVAGPETTAKVFQRVGQSIAEHYAGRIDAGTAGERWRQFARLLANEGTLVDVEERDGSLVLCARSCPYREMLDTHRDACGMEVQMMTSLIGDQVTLLQCRLDGADCCRFSLANLQ